MGGPRRLSRDGDTYSFIAGFAEVEVDVETGGVRWSTISRLRMSAVINPRSLHGQILGGQPRHRPLPQKWVYDTPRRAAREALPPHQAARSSTSRLRCAPKRSASPILKRQPVPAASASRRSVRATAQS
jgi:hypothetical protein